MHSNAKTMYFKLVIPVALTILIVFSVGAAMIFSFYSQWYTEAVIRNTTEIISQTAASLDVIHSHVSKVIYSIGRSQSLLTVLTADMNNSVDKWQSRRAISQIFKNEPTTIVDYELTVVGRNGIAATSGDGGLNLSTDEILTLPLYQKALNGGIAYTSMKNGFTHSTKDAEVIIGCQVLFTVKGEPYGAVFITFKERDFYKYYDKFVFAGSDIVLLGTDGTVLSSTGAYPTGSRDDALSQLCTQALNEDRGWLRTKDNQVVTVLIPIPN